MNFIPPRARFAAALMFCAVALPAMPVLAQQAPMQAGANDEEQPPLLEFIGRLNNGDALMNLDVRTAEGGQARLFDFISGKTALIVMWPGARGPGDEVLGWLDRLAREYGPRGVAVLGVGTNCERPEFERWVAENRGRYSFPVVLDPAGRAPPMPRRDDTLSDEEKNRQFEAFQKYSTSTVSGRLARRSGMLMMPAILVADPDGRFVGWTFGGKDRLFEGVGNLMLRAGVELAERDRPKRVWTREETRPPRPPGGEAPSSPAQMAARFLPEGAEAPDFITVDAQGSVVKLSDYKGKVVVLDFWATWCGPCIASMPEGNRIAGKYKDQDVVLLAVCVQDYRSKFEKWVATNQEKFPNIRYTHDPLENSPDSPARRLYGVSGIPMQYVIGRDGKVKASLLGFSEGDVLLEGALAKAGVNVDPEIVARAEEQLRKRQGRSAAPASTSSATPVQKP